MDVNVDEGKLKPLDLDVNVDEGYASLQPTPVDTPLVTPSDTPKGSPFMSPSH